MLKSLITYSLLLCSLILSGQKPAGELTVKGNPSFRDLEREQADDLYNMYLYGIGRRDELINGRDYFPYYYRSTLKPLLFPGIPRDAILVLNGRTYPDVMLEYDTFTDEVILADTTLVFSGSLYEVSLNSNNIDRFILMFETDTLDFRFFSMTSESGLASGFYELASTGVCNYIIRHRSVTHERNAIDQYFYSPVGYVSTGGGYERIRPSGRFFSIFGEKAGELKDFVRQNRINLRKADKNQIVKILDHYESLLKL
ncbi:MAG: hypothetical protein RBT38_14350 [Bacteroidales bacterium]|jgi:hypothetical protein|nr:hypothetical protein [Bacteroidales bacterium]